MRLPRPLRVETVVSSVSYLPQTGTAKIKMFSHGFEGFPLKKQNVVVKKGISLCQCPAFTNFDGAIVQNYQTLEEIKYCLAITLLQDATRFHGRSIYL